MKKIRSLMAIFCLSCALVLTATSPVLANGDGPQGTTKAPASPPQPPPDWRLILILIGIVF